MSLVDLLDETKPVLVLHSPSKKRASQSTKRSNVNLPTSQALSLDDSSRQHGLDHRSLDDILFPHRNVSQVSDTVSLCVRLASDFLAKSHPCRISAQPFRYYTFFFFSAPSPRLALGDVQRRYGTLTSVFLLSLSLNSTLVHPIYETRDGNGKRTSTKRPPSALLDDLALDFTFPKPLPLALLSCLIALSPPPSSLSPLVSLSFFGFDYNDNETN